MSYHDLIGKEFIDDNPFGDDEIVFVVSGFSRDQYGDTQFHIYPKEQSKPFFSRVISYKDLLQKLAKKKIDTLYCFHDWKEYFGVRDRFWYCDKCNQKQYWSMNVQDSPPRSSKT